MIEEDNIMSSLKDSPIKLEHLIEMAYFAGPIILDCHGLCEKSLLKHTLKDDNTKVTEADIRINRMVIEYVRNISKDIDIVGEELSDRKDSSWQLVCDPIDGTSGLLSCAKESTFMAVVLYKGEPLLSVIFDPFRDCLYFAEKGEGAWLINKHKKKLRLSNENMLKNDKMVVGYVYWSGSSYNILKVCNHLKEKGVVMQRLRSIGYGEALVAKGELAGTIFPGKSHHDTAPGHIIVKEAGGVVSDIFGKALHYKDSEIEGHIFAVNEETHKLLIEAVYKFN